MIEKGTYRLGEYQISEYGDGVLWWHAHCGLGQQRSGKCFIIGDILVVGPFSHEENGFLKREFLERLKKLPIWERTKFYCFASELIDVSSSRSLSKISSDRTTSFGGVHRLATQAARDEIPGVFRLHKYKIAVAGDGRISWEALEGRDLLVGGQCIIKSGILCYLQTNAAEHSSAKRAIKIVRSSGTQMPIRITDIPYIKEKHHDISAATIKRQSIGSLSNCTACHTRAEDGIYDDDFVVIPK